MEFGETSRKTGFISAAACVELMREGDADRNKGKCEIEFVMDSEGGMVNLVRHTGRQRIETAKCTS